MDIQHVLFNRLEALAKGQPASDGTGDNEPWYQLLPNVGRHLVADVATEARHAAYVLADLESGGTPADHYETAVGHDAYDYAYHRASDDLEEWLALLVRQATATAHRAGVLAA
jgi:hypothetical protein